MTVLRLFWINGYTVIEAAVWPMVGLATTGLVWIILGRRTEGVRLGMEICCLLTILFSSIAVLAFIFRLKGLI